MSELRFEAAGTGALLRADTRLEPGLAVTYSASSAALAALIGLASGVELPQRGRVVLDGVTPATTPAARRRIAALLAFEFLPLGGDVRSAVASVLSARGEERNVDTLLGTLGFLARSRTKVHELDPAERRSLALGLALHHEQASVFALFEPLAATHTLAPERVQELLVERARKGAIVLVATASPDVAALLGGAHYEITAGVLQSAQPVVAPARTPCALYVETPDAQRLLSVASADPAVLGVTWHEPTWPHLVTFSGIDLEALAGAVTRAANSAGVALQRVTHSATPAASLAAQTQSGAQAPLSYASVDPQAARPPDQSVGMPTAFADPTQRGGDQGGN